jgi:hypothetical protein
MLQYILEAGKVDVSTFMANPVASVKDITKTHITNRHDIERMRPVWASKTGRCTSFAVKAVAVLMAQNTDMGNKSIYDFATYDLHGHRVARCLKTEVVIDSSSTIPGGAFVLPEGQWQKFEKTEASWKFSKSKSKFERAGNPDGKVVCCLR